MIGLKVNNSGNLAKTVSIIRKFHKNLSISEIKQKIEQGEIVIFHDISQGTDITDELNGIDRNKLFYKLVQDLEENGAAIELYDEEDKITIDILANMLESWNQICEDTELDIARELGDE